MVNSGQTSPGLVLPQISSAPTTIGTPQYVQSAQEGRGKQGQVFTPPQGPGGMQMYNGQSFPSFGVPQTFGNPQPPNQPVAQPAYQNIVNAMTGQMQAGGLNTQVNQQLPVPQQQDALNNVAAQMPSYLPQFTQQPFQPPTRLAAQPVQQQGLVHQGHFGGGGRGDTGYNLASWDRGNGRMPGRTFAR